MTDGSKIQKPAPNVGETLTQRLQLFLRGSTVACAVAAWYATYQYISPLVQSIKTANARRQVLCQTLIRSNAEADLLDKLPRVFKQQKQNGDTKEIQELRNVCLRHLRSVKDLLNEPRLLLFMTFHFAACTREGRQRLLNDAYASFTTVAPLEAYNFLDRFLKRDATSMTWADVYHGLLQTTKSDETVYLFSWLLERSKVEYAGEPFVSQRPKALVEMVHTDPVYPANKCSSAKGNVVRRFKDMRPLLPLD